MRAKAEGSQVTFRGIDDRLVKVAQSPVRIVELSLAGLCFKSHRVAAENLRPLLK